MRNMNILLSQSTVTFSPTPPGNKLGSDIIPGSPS